MPAATSVEIARMRERGHETKWWMVTAPHGDPLCISRLNNGSADRGDTAIPYDNATGSCGDVRPGMTLWVSAVNYGEWELGSIRIKAVTGSVFYVAENDEIEWADDVFLTVPGEAGFRELWSVYIGFEKVGVDDIIHYRDTDVAYTDEGDHMAPKANGGPPVVRPTGTVVQFVGEDSWASEVGEAIGSAQWIFPGGTPANSAVLGTTAVPVNVTWGTAGFRYVELSVVDGLGTTGTTYIPTWIYDDSPKHRLFESVNVQSMQGNREGGWTCRVSVFEENTNKFIDGSLVVIGVESRYGGTEEEIGGFHDRKEIKFVGWIDGETLSFNPTVGTIEFNVVTSDEIMRRLPGFSFSLESNATPTDWIHVKELNLDRAVHHLLEYGSTVNQVCHVETHGDGSGRPLPITVFPDDNIYAQVHDHHIEDAESGIYADYQGILRVRKNPQFLNATDRDAIPVMAELESGDWMDQFNAPKTIRPNTGKIILGGFQESAVLLAQAPGDAPIQQEGENQINNRIVQSQAELNLWAGLHLTLDNNQYPEVPFDIPGFWPIFDHAFQEYVKLTIPDPFNRNDWVGERFLVRGVEFKNIGDRATTTTTLTLEKENDILVGETIVVPEVPNPEPIEIPQYPPLPPPFTPVEADLKHVIVLSNSGIFYTDEFDQVSPSWYACNNGLASGTWSGIHELAFDRTHGSMLYMVNGLGAYRCTDVWSSAAWTQVMPNADIAAAINAHGSACVISNTNCGFRSIACGRDESVVVMFGGKKQNAIGCLNSVMHGFYSTDQMATDPVCGDGYYDAVLAWMSVCGAYGAVALDGGVECSLEDGRTVYTGLNFASAGMAYAWTSDDGGVAIDRRQGFGSFVNIAGSCVHSRAGSHVILNCSDVSNTIYASSNGGTTYTVTRVLPTTMMRYRYALAINRLNTNNWMYVTYNAGGVPSGTLRKTSDYGATWGVVGDPPGQVSCIQPVALDTVGSDGQRFIAGNYRQAKLISYTTDLGDTFVDKTGNLTTWLNPAVDYIRQIIPFDLDS